MSDLTESHGITDINVSREELVWRLMAAERRAEETEALVGRLRGALIAARQWIEPVVSGFGLNPETHVVLSQVEAALSLTPTQAALQKKAPA